MVDDSTKSTDFVDSITKIMDESGPQPRIKYKIVQKRRNGVDKFRDDHQKFEVRKSDPTQNVRRHNKAVPKLYDELKKRRSITTVTTIKLKDIECEFDPKCSACAKFITLNQLQKLNVKPRCTSANPEQHQEAETRREKEPVIREKKKPREENKLSGVKKAKFRARKQAMRCKDFTNRSCQCIVDHSGSKLRTTMSSHVEKEPEVVLQNSGLIHQQEEEKSLSKTAVGSGQFAKSNSEKSLKSRSHSVSTYNSYLSMDHEPMESEDLN